MINEVNAVSEELNKHKAFEIVLISGAAQEGTNKETRYVHPRVPGSNLGTWSRIFFSFLCLAEDKSTIQFKYVF